MLFSSVADMAVADSVPFCDLSRESRDLLPDLEAAASRVLRSGRFLFGPELEDFETEFAAWCGAAHAVGVACGTDAVEIALRALHVERPVACPAMTAPATVNAIEAAGLRPFLVDIDPETWNAPGAFPDAVAVSLYGEPADCLPSAVEDVAHALGAERDGRKAGTRGGAGAFSFYPTKILGCCGDGGAVVTDDPRVAARARAIRHYGTEDGDVRGAGQNSRLSEMQAAILRAKLPRVAGWIGMRRAIAARYRQELSGRLHLPPPGGVFHVFVVLSEDRERLETALRDAGIGTMRHYGRAIHQHARWRHLGEPGAFPEAERLAAGCLSLPCYPYLSDAEQDLVIAAVKGAT